MTVTMTVTLWIRATLVIWKSKRWAFSSPPCGPVPVTTVPVTMARALRTVTVQHRRRTMVDVASR